MGPNSAPNGDRTLVVGYGDQGYVCPACKNKFFASKREHLAKHKMLRTGKTKL